MKKLRRAVAVVFTAVEFFFVYIPFKIGFELVVDREDRWEEDD